MVREVRVAVAAAGVLLGVAGCGSGGAPAPQHASPSARDGELHVLVGYHSRTGNTKRLAEAVAEGARRVEGAAVSLRSVETITAQELDRADAILLGCPTHYAGIPAAMKAVLDDWGGRPEIDLTDKIGGAFATGGGPTGGSEQVVVDLLLYMMSRRMLVAGPLYERGAGKWGELGATAVTGDSDPRVQAGELDAARRLGERVAHLARARVPRVQESNRP